MPPDEERRNMIAAAHKRIQERLVSVGAERPANGRMLVSWECSRCFARFEDERPSTAPPGSFGGTILCRRCADALDDMAKPAAPARPPIYSLPPRRAAAPPVVPVVEEAPTIGAEDLDEEAFTRAAKELEEGDARPTEAVGEAMAGEAQLDRPRARDRRRGPRPSEPPRVEREVEPAPDPAPAAAAPLVGAPHLGPGAFKPSREQIEALRADCEPPQRKIHPLRPCGCGARGQHRWGCPERKPSWMVGPRAEREVAPPIFAPSPRLLATLGLTPPADETRPEPAQPEETRREPETPAAVPVPPAPKEEIPVSETWTCGCGFETAAPQAIAGHKKHCDGTPWPRPCPSCAVPQKNKNTFRMHVPRCQAAPAKKKARAQAPKRALVRRRAPGREPPPKKVAAGASPFLTAAEAVEAKAEEYERLAAEARALAEQLRRLA
jgi:hypothetical protein